MEYNSPNDPIRTLIHEFIEDRYEGVTFSDDFISSIEAKVAPVIRQQTEETVVEFVADFFSAKKPTRKARKPRKKSETTTTSEEADTANTEEPPSEKVTEETPSEDPSLQDSNDLPL